MSGLSMVVDDSIFDDGIVTVLLALPPEHTGAPPKIITTLAEMTYAIHSSKLNAFKIGMAFLEFKSNGKEPLRAARLHELEKVRVTETENPWTGLKGAASINFFMMLPRQHKPRTCRVNARTTPAGSLLTSQRL